MKRFVLLLLSLLVLGSAVDAARPRKVVKKKAKKEEVVEEDPRIVQMLASTQQIMFIDSMVVDLNDFMRHIPFTHDAGLPEQHDTLGQFTNELRDHRLTAYFDAADSACHISQSDYIANTWTEPQRVEGITDASANFPFMMPDGVTLYFAQKGEKSIGGYDIFVTRYDSDSDSFLRAENVGMPFSSTANDYFYAIDEASNLGYFVTDRHQPTGKVCIYVFLPNATRKVYQSEAYSDTEMRALAAINCIAETWTDKQACQQALARLEEVRASLKNTTKVQKQNSELDNLRHQADVVAKALQLARNYYARASESERRTLTPEILQSEKELEALQLEIRKAEKAQRNAEHKKH
jgi:hypothetical protein